MPERVIPYRWSGLSVLERSGLAEVSAVDLPDCDEPASQAQDIQRRLVNL